jgi:hypothetical protein
VQIRFYCVLYRFIGSFPVEFDLQFAIKRLLHLNSRHRHISIDKIFYYNFSPTPNAIPRTDIGTWQIPGQAVILGPLKREFRHRKVKLDEVQTDSLKIKQKGVGHAGAAVGNAFWVRRNWDFFWYVWDWFGVMWHTSNWHFPIFLRGRRFWTPPSSGA